MIEKQAFFANTSRNPLLILLSIGGIVGTLGMLYYFYSRPAKDWDGIITSVIVIGIFVACLIASIHASQRKGPALSIDDDGLFFENYSSSAGRVYWSNIKKTRIYKLRLQGQQIDYLVVDLVNNDQLLNALPTGRRLWLQSNMSIVNSPVFIGRANLAVPIENVQMAIENALYAWRKQQQQYWAAAGQGAMPLQAGR